MAHQYMPKILHDPHKNPPPPPPPTYLMYGPLLKEKPQADLTGRVGTRKLYVSV